jgi:hypothetical protein
LTAVERIERHARPGVSFCRHGISDNVDIDGSVVINGSMGKITRYSYFCRDHDKHGSFMLEEMKAKAS